MRPSPRVLRLLLVGVAYYVGAQAGLALALYNSQVTPFWPPTGIALAALLVWGRSMWPAIAVAAFVVNAPLSDGLIAPSVITVGNVLAPLAAAVVLDRAGFGLRMARLRDATLLVAVGASSMVVSATVGTMGLLSSGLSADRAPSVALVWWTGDAVGALFVTPFLLTLHAHRRAGRPSLGELLEGSALLVLTALATWAGFRTTLPLPFLVLPVLAVAAVRLQVRGAAPTSLVAALVATQAAADGAGLFAHLTHNQAMLVLQLFNASVAFTAYLLAALTASRARSQQALSAQGNVLERQVEQRTAELSRALRELGRAQDIAGIGSFEYRSADDTLTWSDQLYRLAGLRGTAPITPHRYLELCHPDDVELVLSSIREARESDTSYAFDQRLRQPDGTYRWLHWNGQQVHDETGAIVGTRGTATDIHDRKQAELRFAQLVEMAPDALVLVNGEGVITQVNLRTEELFGYAREELVGQLLEKLIPERYRVTHRGHRTRFQAHPGMRPMGPDLDLLALHRNGTEFPVEISLSPLETEQGSLVAAAIRDVTERKQQQAEIAFRGVHDALTGLPNRTLLADRLAHALVGLDRRSDSAVAVLFLDLDHFKWVNDSLGHDAGDQLLRTVAERLLEAVRPEDTVARFGGDEFVVIGTGLARDTDGAELAERLRSCVARPVRLQPGQVVVPTMSIGVTTTSDPRTDPTRLLREADAAMYRAKERGRDRAATFAPEIHSEMNTRLATASGLSGAIEQGQLRVHYQPIVDVPTGRPRGVEALVRWEHPERGLLAPSEFITLAEETGQIGALDRAAILLACSEFGALLRSGTVAADLTLSVNVSLRHLSTSDLRDTLVEALAEGGLDPGQLTVEVTETAQLPSEQFGALLRTVKELGVRVAIDDFGTGFSALSRLNALKVDVIKVDQSFVSSVHTSPRSQALVAAMAQLGTALDAVVVAEGVELDAQAEAVHHLGCAIGQGYLWGPPLPVEELQAWLVLHALPHPREAPSAAPRVTGR